MLYGGLTITEPKAKLA